MKRKVKTSEKKLTLDKFTVVELQNPKMIMGGVTNDGTGGDDHNTVTSPTGRKE